MSECKIFFKLLKATLFGRIAFNSNSLKISLLLFEILHVFKIENSSCSAREPEFDSKSRPGKAKKIKQQEFVHREINDKERQDIELLLIQLNEKVPRADAEHMLAPCGRNKQQLGQERQNTFNSF